MLRSILFILLFNSLFYSYSQNQGAIQVNCVHHQSLEPLHDLTVDVYNDSVCYSDTLNSDGKVLFSRLSSGYYKLEVCNINHLSTVDIFIQPRQLFQFTLPVDTSNASYREISSNQYEVSADGQPDILKMAEESIRSNNQQLSPVSINFSNAPSQNLQEVCIVAYKQPLINHGANTQARTIKRSDIQNMPIRSSTNVATIVGGVNEIEEGQLSVRGARTDANMYFIDGVKVRGSNQLPKSYLGEVRVITGGVPANYGDVLGGVIDIRSRGIDMSAIPPPNYTSSKIEEEPKDFAPVVNYDHFLPIYENQFLSPKNHPHATFGLDVDQAAWSYVKAMARKGMPIKRDAIKLEEMINAFSIREVSVPEDEWAHVEVDRSECAWNTDHELVSVHLKVKQYPEEKERKPHNFVFLIDVSGSMSDFNKLPLVIRGLKDLVQELKPQDRISIVTYAGSTGVPLPSTSCKDKRKILNALDNLYAGGSTNGMGGIQEAYHQAEKYYDSTYNNRIILATDGDFNVGVNSTGGLEKYISEKRGQGIYLTALGFGMGNYMNSTLETLAKRGDGNHFYIESRNEMRSVFADPGNLNNALRDVKLDVQFNPRLISNYRLIGYESRLLRPKDFEDDTKDGGELGYGHEVTAVFEVEKGKADEVENHFVKTRTRFNNKELAYVKLRYKPLEARASIERKFSLSSDQKVKKNSLLNLVIAFGLELRDSAYKGSLTQDLLIQMAKDYNSTHKDERELVEMINLLAE